MANASELQAGPPVASPRDTHLESMRHLERLNEQATLFDVVSGFNVEGFSGSGSGSGFGIADQIGPSFYGRPQRLPDSVPSLLFLRPAIAGAP